MVEVINHKYASPAFNQSYLPRWTLAYRNHFRVIASTGNAWDAFWKSDVGMDIRQQVRAWGC